MRLPIRLSETRFGLEDADGVPVKPTEVIKLVNLFGELVKEFTVATESCHAPNCVPETKWASLLKKCEGVCEH